MPADDGLCACGRALHYSDPRVQRQVQGLVDRLGQNVIVTVGHRRWLVPRHYIALHGINAADLPQLGFCEVKAKALVGRDIDVAAKPGPIE